MTWQIAKCHFFPAKMRENARWIKARGPNLSPSRYKPQMWGVGVKIEKRIKDGSEGLVANGID